MSFVYFVESIYKKCLIVFLQNTFYFLQVIFP